MQNTFHRPTNTLIVDRWFLSVSDEGEAHNGKVYLNSKEENTGEWHRYFMFFNDFWIHSEDSDITDHIVRPVN